MKLISIHARSQPSPFVFSRWRSAERNAAKLRSTLSAADRRIVKKGEYSLQFSQRNNIFSSIANSTHTYDLAFDVDGRLVKNCDFCMDIEKVPTKDKPFRFEFSKGADNKLRGRIPAILWGGGGVRGRCG